MTAIIKAAQLLATWAPLALNGVSSARRVVMEGSALINKATEEGRDITDEELQILDDLVRDLEERLQRDDI